MQETEPSHKQRIANLVNLRNVLAKAVTPEETLNAVTTAMQNAFGPTTFIGLSTRGLGRGNYRIVQMSVDGVPVAGFESWENHTSPVRSGGILGQIISKQAPQLVQDLDWTRDSDLNVILGDHDSLMAIPMGSNRIPIDWAVILKRGAMDMTEADFEESILRATLIGSLLDSRAMAQELAAAHSQIDREFRDMGELQRSLLPKIQHAIAGLDIAATYTTSTRTGGDIYDIFPDQDGHEKDATRWCIFVGDATGHGAPAAVVIAIVQAVLRALPSDLSVSERISRVNRQLCNRGLKSALATAFFAIYDMRSQTLIYTSAGHPMPLLHTPGDSKSTELPAKPNLMLGADPDACYVESTHHLKQGQTLLIYTDGITESRSPTGAFLESGGLFSAFGEQPSSAAELIHRIRQIVLEHHANPTPLDDQTAIAIVKQ